MTTTTGLDRQLRALDPAEEIHVATVAERQQLRDRILDLPRIEAGDDRRLARGRTRRPLGLAMAAAAALLIVAVGVPGLPGLQQDAYAVRPLQDGRIELDLLAAATTDADEVAAQLREFGVDVAIDPVSSPPSLVGSVLGVSGSHATGPGGDWPPAGITFSETNQTATVAIDPGAYHGSLSIQVAVPAAGDGTYDRPVDALLPGGSLADAACALGHPVRVSDLLPVLRQLDLDPVWMPITDTREEADSGYTTVTDTEPTLTAPSGTVVMAEDLSPDLVSIMVLPDTINAPYVIQGIDHACSEGQPADPSLPGN